MYDMMKNIFICIFIKKKNSTRALDCLAMRVPNWIARFTCLAAPAIPTRWGAYDFILFYFEILSDNIFLPTGARMMIFFPLLHKS